jgi:hypothetical protein
MSKRVNPTSLIDLARSGIFRTRSRKFTTMPCAAGQTGSYDNARMSRNQMVVDAVRDEPVSAQICGKQGNNREFLRNLTPNRWEFCGIGPLIAVTLNFLRFWEQGVFQTKTGKQF